MVQIEDIKRPPKDLIAKLHEHVSAATASGDLNKLGVRNAYGDLIQGFLWRVVIRIFSSLVCLSRRIVLI